MTFDGLRPANEYAEIESKKQNTEMYVIKSMIGGIKYNVIKPIIISGKALSINLREDENILSHYKNGLIIK